MQERNCFTDEIWKAIPRYHGFYEVSNYGRIRRSDNGFILKTPINAVGYPVFSVRGGLFDPPRNNRKNYPVTVHSCEALAFLPNPDNLNEINHKDGNKANNILSNLEWCTHAYNMYHSGIMGLSKGYGHKPVIQLKNGAEIARYPSIEEAARQTGIKPSAIGNVANHRVKKDGAHYRSAGGFVWEFVKKKEILLTNG